MSEFERIRDSFFIDPHARTVNGHDLANAADTVIHGIVAGVDYPYTSANDTPIVEAARDIAGDFQGARRFDHLSVAQLHPSDNMLGVIGNLASTIRNNNTIVAEVSPVETAYEIEGVNWMLEHVAGFNVARASGALTSGGTSANHTAMLAARERLEAEGWKGEQPAMLFGSTMTHYSISKTARMLAPAGLIKNDKVPLEAGGYRMDPAALEERVKDARKHNRPIMGIVAVAGETETGLVDDLDAIADIASKYGVYLHVDGAYGAPFRLSREGKAFDSVSAADSLTCDPHKYLYVPYSAGAIMFADAGNQAIFAELNKEGAAYMFQDDEGSRRARELVLSNLGNLGQKRLEGSMGGQAAASLHAVITHIGHNGIAALLDHTLDMTETFQEATADIPGLTSSFTPQLNTLCLEPSPAMRQEASPKVLDSMVERTSEILDKEHGIYLSTTSLPDKEGDRSEHHKVFRFVATHPHTNQNDVQYIARTLKTTWESITNE